MKTSNLGRAGILWLVFTCIIIASDASAQIQQSWIQRYNNGITNGEHQALKMALDGDGYAYIAGTYKINVNGAYLWTNLFPLNGTGTSGAHSIATDAANNCSATGYFPDANGTNDIVTFAL